MTKRVQEKAKLIDMPKASDRSAVAGELESDATIPPDAGGSQPGTRRAPPEIVPGERAFTGVGVMMSSLGKASPLGQELEAAKARLKDFDGSSLVRRLDATTVVPSRWANRDESEFATKDFADFKAEIESAGGNVQPIRVRPIREVFDGQTALKTTALQQVFDRQTPAAYEVVFGLRRHRACLELGLPVNAMIEDIDDLGLFQVMDRENRQRKNLSPWEQGTMYRKALDEGLFPSLRRLSEVLGVNLSVASQSVAIARLPADVVRAFRTPLDIQFRWAAPLAEVVQKDPEGVLDRAKALRQVPTEDRQPKSVLTALLDQQTRDASKRKALSLEKDGKVVALLKPKGKGGIDIEIRVGIDLAKAESAVRKLLGL